MHHLTSYLRAEWISKVVDNKVSGFSSENMADRFSPSTRPMPKCGQDMSCNRS